LEERKKEELRVLQESNDTIPDNLSEKELNDLVDGYLKSEPLKSLVAANGRGCFTFSLPGL